MEERKNNEIVVQMYLLNQEMSDLAINKSLTPEEKIKQAKQIFNKMRAITKSIRGEELIDHLNDETKQFYRNYFGEDFFESLDSKEEKNDELGDR